MSISILQKISHMISFHVINRKGKTIMGNLIKKCFKLFIVCMMCVSVVACGARNKDYSEISQI